MTNKETMGIYHVEVRKLMVEIYDLNDNELSKKNGLYGGAAGSKDGIIINGENWMVKYPKSTKLMKNVDISYSTSAVSEYLGSHIFQILGYSAHETILGIRHGKLVVACKDFTDENTMLAEMRTIKNHSNEILSEKLGIELDSTGESHKVDLETIMLHIRHNPILKNIENVEERFFEQAIIDIYINNNDRNSGNWGILRHFDKTPDELAPIYDNGGCFLNKLSDKKAFNLLQNPDLARKYACGTQTAYADPEGHVYSPTRFLALRKLYPKLNNAILKVVPLITEHQKEIEDLICSLPEKTKDAFGKEYDVYSRNIKDLNILHMETRLKEILQTEYQKVLEEQNKTNVAEKRIDVYAKQVNGKHGGRDIRNTSPENNVDNSSIEK